MTLKILIAEDEEDILQQYKLAFKEKGHRVVGTVNGIDCLREYRRNLDSSSDSLPFDVLIVDYNMPSMNGAQLAKEIHALRPKQRIIFVTAYGEKLLGNLAGEEGVEMITKPVSLSYLIRLVEESEYE